MIEHIVLIELPEAAESHRSEIIRTLHSFAGIIEGVVSSHAGTDFSGRCTPYSVVAVLEIESTEALDAYAVHPAHRKLIALFDRLGCRRMVADFER